MSKYFYKVVEKFVSINGEGRKVGELATFIRFKGCNLNCSYCDTLWANKKNAKYTLMSDEDILSFIKEKKVKNVTLTGGEPLLQDNISYLIEKIIINGFNCEIETNGSVDILPFTILKYRPSLTIDYKAPSSNMEKFMYLDNFKLANKNDTIKFVVGSIFDLEKTKEIINKFDLLNNTYVYISPIFGMIEPSEIVDFMIKENLNKARLQIQIHKVIWDPDKKGV